MITARALVEYVEGATPPSAMTDSEISRELANPGTTDARRTALTAETASRRDLRASGEIPRVKGDE